MKDLVLTEYKKRIEKIKSEEELERIALDELKELKQRVFLEYKKEQDALEKIKEERQNEESEIIKLQEVELMKYNYILKMSDGTYQVASKDEIDIASEKDLNECKECEI